MIYTRLDPSWSAMVRKTMDVTPNLVSLHYFCKQYISRNFRVKRVSI